MAKKTRVSYVESKNLSSALCNAKYKAPVVLARVLLEGFIFEDGNFSAEWFVREKACEKGNFTKLRDRLVTDNWLHFREDSKRYFPGIRLKPYLDALRESRTATLADIENIASKMADKSEIAALDLKKADRAELEMKLEKTNKRIQEIASAVKELQEAMLPPDSDEKKMKREKSASTIARLSQAH